MSRRDASAAPVAAVQRPTVAKGGRQTARRWSTVVRMSVLVRRVGLILAGAMLLATGAAWSQDRYYFEMRDRFLQAAVMLRQAGYSLSHEPYVRTYGNQRYRDFTLDLEGGGQYAVFAVGDDDAADLDIEVYDERGRLIARDQRQAQNAIVGVEPRYSARHTIRVIMQDCRSREGFCYAGVGVFVR